MMLTGSYTQVKGLLDLRFYADSIDLKKLSRVSSSSVGARRSRLQSRGIEFAGVRLYQPGDDVRTIDWRVTARKNKPHTKEFTEERDRPLMLLLDQTPSMFFGSRARLKSVLGAETAALIAWAALNKGYRVGGILLGDGEYALVKPKQNRNNLLRLIHQINSFNNQLTSPHSKHADYGIEVGIRQLCNHVQTGSLIVIISDFNSLLNKSKEITKYLWKITRHNSLLAFLISDPLEVELPPPASYPVTDGESDYFIDAGDSRSRREYAQVFADKQAALLELCRRQRSHCVSLFTQETLLDRFLPDKDSAPFRHA